MGKQFLKIAAGVMAVCLLTGCTADDAAEEKTFTIPAETWNPGGTVESIAAAGGYLFALMDGGIVRYDGVTEDAPELAVTDPLMLCGDGDTLYIADSGADKILAVDPGTMSVEWEIPFADDGYRIYDFDVTENYLVFLAYSTDPFGLTLIDKTDGTISTKEISESVVSVSTQEADTLWLYNGSRSSTQAYISRLNLADMKSVGNLKTDVMHAYAMTYNPEWDFIIYTGYGDKVDLLSPEDSKVRTISFEGGVSSGMVTDGDMLAWAMEDGVHFYDLNELDNAVTIATYGFPTMTIQYLIEEYARDTGILIQEINIEEKETIDLLLLSGDPEYDLFLMPSYMYFADYVRNHAYEDLAAFNGMLALAQSSGVSPIGTQNGEMFGVPVDIAVVDNRNYGADESLVMLLNLNQYMEENIDLTVPAYYDEDASGLVEVLEYIRDYDLNTAEYPVLYKGDNTMVECSYLMLNRASAKQEDAVKFLRYVMEYHAEKNNADDDDIANDALNFTWYPDLTLTEDSTPLWKFETTEIRLVFLKAARNIIAGASVEEEAKTAWEAVRYMILE